MAHMRRKKGEFKRGFGKGPKRKELKPRELPGGRDVLIPLGRLYSAIGSKHLKRCDVDPRLMPMIMGALEGAKEKGISISKEIRTPPPCPTSVISSALSEGDKILSMGKRLGHVIGKKEARKLSAALEATMPKLVGMKRLCG